jgi:TonB family protein
MRPLFWAETAALAFVAALLTLPALAQETAPLAGRPIAKPVWLTEPPRADMSFAFFARDYRSHVELRCTVAGEALSACQAVEPTPPEFLAAAAAAAHAARIGPQDTDGQATDGREVTVSIFFPPMPIPFSVGPPPAPPTPAIMTAPTWLAQPTAQDFSRYYPPRAFDEGVSGSATVDCLVDGAGLLACTVVSEEPEGYGFGEAALRISRHFRVAPETRDGRSTVGARIRRTIRFAI